MTKNESSEAATVALRRLLSDVLSLSKYKTDKAEGAEFARVRIQCQARELCEHVWKGRPDLKEAIKPILLEVFPEIRTMSERLKTAESPESTRVDKFGWEFCFLLDTRHLTSPDGAPKCGTFVRHHVVTYSDEPTGLPCKECFPRSPETPADNRNDGGKS